MDLSEMLSIIWRTKWIALLTALITVTIVTYFSMQQEATYQSQAVLLVGKTGVGDVTGKDLIAASYAELVKAPEVLDMAIETSGLDMSTSELRSHVSSVTNKERPYIELSAQDQKPELAMQEVNAVANSLSSYVNDMQEKNISSSMNEIYDELAQVERELASIRSAPVVDGARLQALEGARLTLLKQYEQKSVQALGENGLTIVRLAQDAQGTVPQKMRNIIFGLVAGCVVGIGVGFLTDSIRKALR